MTALVSLGTGGAMTAFSLVPGKAAAELKSPTSAHIRLLALQQAARPALADDGRLRSAIVNVAGYYLRMAQSKTPAEMEALIWQHDSIDGVDHGESCAAFASLTLELGAQVVGQQSWVTGGSTYPWPLHKWADVRVDPNPDSLGITSVLQDAQAHGRWHPLGDGYRPLPGDWVLFDGHVEVVTKYAGGVLHTIGGDSGPNLSVNAHAYPAPLAAQGIAGFVNNGDLPAARGGSPAPTGHQGTAGRAAGHQGTAGRAAGPDATVLAASGQAAIPGVPGATAGRAGPTRTPRGTSASAVPGSGAAAAGQPAASRARPGWERDPHRGRPAAARPRGRATADVPDTGRAAPAVTLDAAAHGTAAIPGLRLTSPGHLDGVAASPAAGYGRYRPPAVAALPGDAAQAAFIREVAPGAQATQARYGVPAAVTIAQAIDESGWGSSDLATQDHNLFGIKGTGPAGSDVLPTQEYVNGQYVSTMAPFRVYRNVAQSINDHGELLANSGYYQRAMSETHNPDAFASALTGVYATDPSYGVQLIGLMRQYNLYQFDRTGPASRPSPRRAPATPAAARPASSGKAAHGGASAGPGTRVRPAQPRVTRTPAAHARPSRARLPHGPAPHGRPSLSPPPHSPAPRPVPSVGGAAHSPAPPAGSSPAPAPSRPAPGGTAVPGVPPNPQIPGVSKMASTASTNPPAAAPSPKPSPDQDEVPETGHRAAPPSGAAQTVSARLLAARSGGPSGPASARAARTTRITSTGYQPQLPPSVKHAFTAQARGPLSLAEPLYRDVAASAGIGWELLAACDWMQCRADPRRSPVHGEKLGTVNPDGTAFRTKSAALEQCADDLVALAMAVYRIDLAAPDYLSVRDLANAFAAFRWGGLLKLHRTSAMEFPYSVAGLTAQHLRMRWPNIDEPNTPDKPGTRFRMPFGAVPVVLGLEYPATV